MLNVSLISVVSFSITLLAIPAIMKVANEKKLYDLPDARKLHNRPIASLGGVGIFIGFFLAALLSIPAQYFSEFQYFFASALVVFFLGLKDDILIISAIKKFIGQVAATAILVHLGGVRIESMFGFLGIYELPEVISIMLSYTTIIVVINAYNLIDGVDGLAASLGILTTLIFGTYFYMAGMELYSMIGFGMAGSLISFLLFNRPPAKIFMGDSGSLVLGLINSILVIKMIAVADTTPVAIPVSSAVALGFSILIVPLLDTLRVFSIRISKGRSPFAPDRNHIHHLLLDCGLSHRFVTLSCVGLNVSFIAMAYFGRALGPTWLILLMITAFYSIVAVMRIFRKSSSRLVIASSFKHNNVDHPLPTPSTKIVSLKNEPAVAEQ